MHQAGPPELFQKLTRFTLKDISSSPEAEVITPEGETSTRLLLEAHNASVSRNHGGMPVAVIPVLRRHGAGVLYDGGDTLAPADVRQATRSRVDVIQAPESSAISRTARGSGPDGLVARIQTTSATLRAIASPARMSLRKWIPPMMRASPASAANPW